MTATIVKHTHAEKMLEKIMVIVPRLRPPKEEMPTEIRVIATTKVATLVS